MFISTSEPTTKQENVNDSSLASSSAQHDGHDTSKNFLFIQDIH